MDFDYITLYVEDVARSERFYTALLGITPFELSAVAAMYMPESGSRLVLWARDGVVPAPAQPGGSELALSVYARSDVDALYARWTQLGATAAQPPGDTFFGYTFLVTDPDGHRLRAFCRPGR